MTDRTELKQGTRVRFTAAELSAYEHTPDNKLTPATHRVREGDMGMWAAKLPDDEDGAAVHMFAIMTTDGVLMVPAREDWFEVVE